MTLRMPRAALAALTAGWVRYSRPAAAVTPPCSTTAANTLSRLRSRSRP